MAKAQGSDHCCWKGSEASYKAIHIWMSKHYPKTGRCEYCGCTDRRTQYASASHDRYTRNRADWFEFCVPCHRVFDGVTGKPFSLEHLAALSAAHQNVSPETRAKISASKIGGTHSPETKAKMSAAHKVRWAKRLGNQQ
jgi:NUMOD3 motif